MTVKDYIELQDKSEIDVIIRFSQKSKEKIDWLQLGSYENWEFDFVKEMQQRINELCFYDFVVICDDYFKKKIGGMELFNAI
ncbi:MAG: hypothetical protein N2692_03085, partial [Patescibacteria group bacterium]|nr:hypothetical protein [Patescibacteria group bacterium]